MQITVSNVITIENPTDNFIQWSAKNLKLPNPEYSKKARMGFWLGNTPKEIQLYKKIGNRLILPFGALRDLPVDEVQDDTKFLTDFASPARIDYGEPVPLYDYQEKAVAALYENQYGILQSKPASGKTQMGIALTKMYGKRTLWLTHTIDLLNQSKERAERYIDKKLIGTITAGKVNISEGITFATIQTLAKQDLNLLKDTWDLIIVDECHRVCTSASSTTMFEKVLNGLAARHKYGLSATVHRADGLIKATYALLGQVVYKVPDEDVEDRVMQVGILPIGTGVKTSQKCLYPDGTLNYQGMISYLTEHFGRNEEIVEEIKANKDHSCLILSERVNHLSDLRYGLPDDMFGKSVMITGKMTSKQGKKEREEALEDMRTGKAKYLFATYQLAKEGLDIPRLDRLFLASPVKDYAVVSQAVGRIARRHDKKKDAICLDFVDDIPYLQKAYKQRLRTYRKDNCYMVTE